MSCHLMWHPKTCLHPQPPCLKNYGRWYPPEHFPSNTSAYWWDLRNTLPLTQFNNTICNTKTTFHCNIFPHRKYRLAHLKHESNVSSKIQVSLFAQLLRSIIPLENLCPTQNQCKLTAYFIALVGKRMWFLPDTHKPRGEISVPLHHALVEHIYPRLVELIRMFFFVPPTSASYEIIHPHTSLPCLYT